MKPRILLVEDDPTTASFLAAAAEGFPARVDAVGTRALALARARAPGSGYALWLVDAHLPDGDGADLLGELRGLGFDTPAVAHTAARDPGLHQALREAGFASVLVKPLGTAELHAALASALRGRDASRIAEVPPPPPPVRMPPDTSLSPPAWDEAAALRALNGQRAHVEALRQLFLAELPATRQQVLAAAGDGRGGELQGMLHRLLASCGFVGAARLQAAVRELQDAPSSAAALARFDAAAQELSPIP